MSTKSYRKVISTIVESGAHWEESGAQLEFPEVFLQADEGYPVKIVRPQDHSDRFWFLPLSIRVNSGWLSDRLQKFRPNHSTPVPPKKKKKITEFN